MPVGSIATTSWDDGTPSDIKIAALLSERGLAGTFYVPIAGPNNRSTMSAPALRALCSQGFEIGAHGTSHRTLPQLSDYDLAREVQVCRMQLEDMVSEKVRMFCYPKGQYDARVIREVQRAGYEGARTTEMLGLQRDKNPYRMSTTVHAFPHTKLAYLKNMVRARHFLRATAWTLHGRNANTWVDLAKRTFDQSVHDAGVWHLYGHSWAIEEQNLWDDLIEVLDYVAHRKAVAYLSNCEVLNVSLRHGPTLAEERQTTA
jgi:peptidoglycan-N-acetylglucosamine deacetylase